MLRVGAASQHRMRRGARPPACAPRAGSTRPRIVGLGPRLDRGGRLPNGRRPGLVLDRDRTWRTPLMARSRSVSSTRWTHCSRRGNGESGQTAAKPPTYPRPRPRPWPVLSTVKRVWGAERARTALVEYLLFANSVAECLDNLNEQPVAPKLELTSSPSGEVTLHESGTWMRGTGAAAPFPRIQVPPPRRARRGTRHTPAACRIGVRRRVSIRSRPRLYTYEGSIIARVRGRRGRSAARCSRRRLSRSGRRWPCRPRRCGWPGG